MEYSTIWLSNFFFPLWVSHLATFRGREAGLFHAYWVISSCGLFFGKWFLRGFDHRWINDFLLPLSVLRLNNLSFLGFNEMPAPDSYMHACSFFFFFFYREYHVFLICFDSRTVGWIAEYAVVYLQRLEDATKPAAKFTSKFGPWRDYLKAFFCSEDGFKVRTDLSLFTVNDPCQLPSVNFDLSLRPTVTHT